MQNCVYRTVHAELCMQNCVCESCKSRSTRAPCFRVVSCRVVVVSCRRVTRGALQMEKQILHTSQNHSIYYKKYDLGTNTIKNKPNTIKNDKPAIIENHNNTNYNDNNNHICLHVKLKNVF